MVCCRHINGLANLQQMKLEEEVRFPLLAESLLNSQEKWTAAEQLASCIHQFPLSFKSAFANLTGMLG